MTTAAAPARRSPLSVTLGVLTVVFFVLSIIAGFWVDWQWYRSVAGSSVYTGVLAAKVAMFAAVALPTFFAVWGSISFAHRRRPQGGFASPEAAALYRYRESLEPVRRVLFLAGPAFFAVLMGLSGSAQWRVWMLWRNSQPFGTTDAQFGRDLSFFVFQLPFLQYVLGVLFTIVVVSGLGCIAVNYVYGGLRPGGLRDSTVTARSQVIMFLGLLALLKSVAYLLDRYALAAKSDSLMSGLRYTDVNAVVPAKTILSYVALATAVLFFISLARPGWSLAFIAFGTMLGASLLLGGVYPAIVQQIQVRPSELQRETPYIQRNLDATKAAYGLGKVKISEYAAVETPSSTAVKDDAGTLGNIRLLDPSLLSPTFRQLQQIRGFYAFPDSLDIDRYSVDGKQRGTVLAVREVNLAGVADSQRNWFNDHMVFTHGYGVVAAFENAAGPDGSPAFYESNIPPTGAMKIEQPRVYFGELSPSYSIVGGTGPARELDYPDDKSANGQASNTYSGSGGVPIGSLISRIAYAIHYRDTNILLSNQITAGSRILYDRDPATRVKKLAPWLTLDSDPYPVVVDGRILWMVDGYTTSNNYPYSARVSLRDATADSVNTQDAFTQLSSGDITYIRNAVKATVDAYDGTVTLYAWDDADPVLKAWMKAFPGVVKPKSAMPSGVLSHVRYPEDMFKVQRNVLAKYHVSDPQAFYSGQDFWIVPDDPTKPALKQAQPPYFLTLRMPDQKEPSFQLTTAYAPSKRQTLAAFMAANSDPGEDYGTIRVLQLPRNTTIPGPTQVQNNFESDPDVSTKLSLLRSGGSDVELGNLLSLPVGGGLLYFEPVYVRASAGEGYPLLRKVLVAFGSKVAFEDDLATALSQIFNESVPVDTGGGVTPGTGGSTGLAAAIDSANRAYADAQAALKRGDFAAYGAAQARLEAALKAITAAANAGS